MKTTSLAAVFVLALSPALNAQIVSTVTNWSSGSSQTNQFNTNSGYQRTFDVQQQPYYPNGAWNTTDPFNTNTGLGGTSLVAFIGGWTPRLSASGNNSVYWGGYNADNGVLPGITNPSIYYSFNSVLVGPNDSVSYTVDFGLIAGTSGTYTNKDLFGISLLTSGGSSLASFSFNPFTATSTNGLRVQWERNGTNVVTNGTSFKGVEIQYGSLYRLTATAQGTSIGMSIAGLTTQSAGGQGITNYNVVTNQQIITGGALSTGFTASDFQRSSMDWELSSGDASLPGANYMIITAASVVSQLQSSAIPEPGTWAAAALLLAGGAYAARRRSNKAS